jgi:hypothetical protein
MTPDDKFIEGLRILCSIGVLVFTMKLIADLVSITLDWIEKDDE